MNPNGVRLGRCPVCFSVARPWGERAGNSHTWRIARCTECGYAFVDPRPDGDYLSAMYAGESAPTSTAEVLAREEEFPNGSLDAARFMATAMRLGAPAGQCLDVGCGYGFSSAAARGAGLAPVMLEIDGHSARVAADIAGAAPRAVTFEAFDAPEASFAVIVMSQVLEHAGDVNLWGARASRLLRPGGLLVVALPNFDSLFRRAMGVRDPFVTPPHHLNFFSAGNLSALLARHGLAVEERQWTSRLSAAALRRRLGPAARLVPHRAAFAAIDRLGLGMYVTVYARKPSANALSSAHA